MMKRILAAALVLLCLMQGALAEEAPYAGYLYNSWGEAAECPNIFLPDGEYLPVDMGLESPLKNPSDLYADEKTGLFYIADTGNNRIVVLDASLRFVREVTTYQENGQAVAFRSPKGVSMDMDGNLLVADTGNSCAVRIRQDGTLLHRYTQPESALYPQEILFQPVKVASDLENNVYALVPSVYQGIVLFSQEGEFLNFYGGNTVNVTSALLLDYYWKKILSQEQAEKMARYVPINYLSLDMSDDGYMYVTLYSDSTKRQIKKLNALGKNILRVETEDKAKYGDLDVLYLNGTKTDTQLADIAVDQDGFIYALDSSRGRVFLYSQSSDSLGVFGGSGRQTGLFSSACAIDTLAGRVYVLDSVRGSVTCFSSTAYGASMMQAVRLYEQGMYAESEALWEELLRQNQFQELAYDGIAKALLARGEYARSLPYFEKANDTYWYSKAFNEYRVEAVRAAMPTVFAVAVVLIAALIVVKKLLRKRGKREEKRPGAVRLALSTVAHPISGYDEIRYAKQYSSVLAGVILAAWFLFSVIEYQYTGFLFNGHKPDSINVLLIFAKTVGLFFLLIFVNNALSTFMDGESTLRQLWISCAYALMPYLLLKLACFGLSHALSLEEGVWITVLNGCAVIWLAWQIICAVQTMQQYTLGKTLASLLFTVVGLAVVLFIAFLFFSLLQQVWSFIRTVFDELMLWQ